MGSQVFRNAVFTNLGTNLFHEIFIVMSAKCLHFLNINRNIGLFWCILILIEKISLVERTKKVFEQTKFGEKEIVNL